jgi:hypothetical protein
MNNQIDRANRGETAVIIIIITTAATTNSSLIFIITIDMVQNGPSEQVPGWIVKMHRV